MEKEQVFLKLFGRNLISFKMLDDGDIIGAGILNPLIKKLRLLVMLVLQAGFYKNYNLGRWKGKIVPNTFAPPIGSRPQLRAFRGLIKSHLLPWRVPLAMTFAVTYRCQCNCVHCSAGKHLKKDVPDLTTEEAKKLSEIIHFFKLNKSFKNTSVQNNDKPNTIIDTKTEEEKKDLEVFQDISADNDFINF